MNLKTFFEVVDYRITEGSEYGWTCFGENAYCLSSWNGDQDGWSCSMIFDTRDQTVYNVEVADYKRKRAYRFINPLHREAHQAYGKANCPDYMNQAWDDVNYVDLEVEEDWIDKARKIVADEDYDHKVSVPLELSDEELFQLMKMAHERDITLNKMVEEILWEAIRRSEAHYYV
jgi:hypothetical protein